MAQYFENDPTLEHHNCLIDYYINDKKLSFISDSGVFSKSTVDYGSSLLIKQILKEDKYDEVLDLGCGYGIIGLTLNYFSKCNFVTFSDVNVRALELTMKNIALYNFNNTKVIESNCMDNIDGKFDLIVLNPPIRAGKKIIYKMYEQAPSFLKDNGVFYIVIKKSLGAPSTITYLKKIFNHVEIKNKDSGYYIIKSFNIN